MTSRDEIQQLMPLVREFGALERRRLGEGIEPIEYLRWLDLRGRIGERFAKSRSAALAANSGDSGLDRPTRLRVAFKTRAALRLAVVENIVPAGFFVPTPFAADVGTEFVACVHLEHERETAEIPVVVVTSMCESAHTLSTMSMGMGLKILRPSDAQAASISRIFGGVFDAALGVGH